MEWPAHPPLEGGGGVSMVKINQIIIPLKYAMSMF